MAEIDIQKMIEDYNNISRHNYYSEASEIYGDGEKASEAAENEYYKRVKNFNETYKTTPLITNYVDRSMADLRKEPIPSVAITKTEGFDRAHLLGIKQEGKYLVLPNFTTHYNSSIDEYAGFKELFESGYKGDRTLQTELNEPAKISIGENGSLNMSEIEKGKLTLHEGGFFGSGEKSLTTSSNEQASTPGGNNDNTTHQEKTEVPSGGSETTHSNTYSGSSYDFNNAKQNMRDEIFGVKEDKEKGIEAKKGIEAEHKYLTDPKLRESRRSSMQNEDVVSIKRFNRAREYYKQNMDRIQAIDKHLNNARASFSEQEQKELLSDKNIKNINKALNEAKAEYDSAVLDAKRAGTKVPEYNSENINKQVAQKVFGNTDIESINAVQYADLKTTGDNLKARFQRRNDIIGRAIDPALERNENKIARGPRAGSSGWKGKAAIFGGVALGALALVGVASMVMSGGRQQNSNLYNPYQAMY